MVLVKPSQGNRSLGAIWIALALAIAAFLGAVLGMVWQSSDLVSAPPEEERSAADDKPARAPESARAH